MKVLTYTSYKEHNDLYTKIQGSIAVNGCQVGIAQKDIILLSGASLIVYKAGKKTSVTNTEFIRFTLSKGTYSIDNINVKIKIAILQQRQGWEPPQIKDLRLVIPKDYLSMVYLWFISIYQYYFLCPWYAKDLISSSSSQYSWSSCHIFICCCVTHQSGTYSDSPRPASTALLYISCIVK